MDTEEAATTGDPTRNALSFSVLSSPIPNSLLELSSRLDFFLGKGRKKIHFDPLLFHTQNKTQLHLALIFNHTASHKKWRLTLGFEESGMIALGSEFLFS